MIQGFHVAGISPHLSLEISAGRPYILIRDQPTTVRLWCSSKGDFGRPFFCPVVRMQYACNLCRFVRAFQTEFLHSIDEFVPRYLQDLGCA